MSVIGILGAGAYGTALANAGARAGHSVLLWGRDASALATIAKDRENKAYLPGCLLESAVAPTSDLTKTLAADVLLLAVPSQATRATLRALPSEALKDKPLILCAKGIEQGTSAFLPDIIAAEAPQARAALLSGPSFAADIARGLPTAVTLAASDETLAEDLSRTLGSSRFRLYHTSDMRGTAIGGAAKNVLAIACGIIAGLELGASAHAALVTRSFAELMRFGLAFGARSETLMGLSGLGDLILTCNSPQSRNFSLGLALARGQKTDGKLAEGAFTADSLVRMAQAKAIDMPVCTAVDNVLKGTITVQEAITTLMSRPQRQEGWA